MSQLTVSKIVAVFFISTLFLPQVCMAGDFVTPVPAGDFSVTSTYGLLTHSSQNDYYAIDFQMSHAMNEVPGYSKETRCLTLGAPILSTQGGTVSRVGTGKEEKKDYGTFAEIINYDGTKSLYGHMIYGTLAVKKDEQVKVGQILGLMGDTGYTLSFLPPCPKYNGLDTDPTGFVGIHLHFRTLNSNNEAILSEPLVGAKNYNDITPGKYTSTTLMYDPTGHWAKYAGKVPYRLTYNPTRVASFGPLAAEGGKEQVFTIVGENLFENLKVTLPGCKGGIKWLKKEGDEQQFSCTFVKPGQPEIKPGFIEYGAEKIHFQIEVLPDSSLPEPVITNAKAINPIAGKLTDFVVEGQHLPGDLQLTGLTCEDRAYKSISPGKQEFSCKLPISIYEGSRRVNRVYTFNSQLSSSERSYSYPFPFSADYEVNVHRVTPDIAHAGEKTLFSFVGKNLHLINAMWVENCQNLREIGQTEGSIRFECSFPTEEEEGFMSLLTPNFFKQNKYRILLKDKSGGTSLFDERISVFYFKNLHVTREQNGEKLFSEIAEGGGMPEGREDGEFTVKDLPDLNDNEAIIKYIIESNGEYSNDFLSKMSWANVGTEDNPVYKLIDCNQELKNIEKGKNDLKLNTTGECAGGLNNVFLN